MAAKKKDPMHPQMLYWKFFDSIWTKNYSVYVHMYMCIFLPWVHACVCVCVFMPAWVCACVILVVLLPCVGPLFGMQRLNSGRQPWLHMPSPTEPSCLLLVFQELHLKRLFLAIWISIYLNFLHYKNYVYIVFLSRSVSIYPTVFFFKSFISLCV